MKNVCRCLLFTLLVTACGRAPDAAHDFNKGVAYFQENKYSKAIPYFENALVATPNHTQALNFLAVCQLHENRPDAALKLLQDALKLDSNYTAARYNLALAQLALGHPEEAVKELRLIPQDSSELANSARQQLGYAYVRLGAWTQANETLRGRVRSAEDFNTLGVINVRLRNFTAARDYFTNAIAADPSFAPAYLNVAVIEQENLKRKKEAAEHYRKFIELAPSSESRDTARRALAQLTQEPAKVVIPAPVVVITPVKPQKTPKPEPAPPPKPEPVVVTPTPVPPTPTPAPVVTVAEPVKRPRGTIPTTPLRSGSRNKATVLYNRGVQQQQNNNLAAAIAAYQEAVQADPSFAAPYYNMAICYRNAGQTEKALDLYELALQANPNYTDARFNYAILLQQQGYTEESITQYEKLVAANPNDAPSHYGLANLYAQNKATTAKAREHYQAYLRLAPNSALARDIRRWLDQNR